jgi:predicted phage tail protein
MRNLKRGQGILLTVLGIILIVVSLVVLNGLGGLGTGHTRADVFFALGAVFIVVGAVVMLTRPG